MGPEAAAGVSYLSSVVLPATALAIEAQRQQEKKQRTILNRAMDETDQTQAKTAEQTLAEAETMSGTSRAKALQEAQDAAFARTQNDLSGAGIIDPSQPESGRKSDAFLQTKADREAGEADRLTSIARELSKVRGVDDVVNNENQSRSALAESLGSMWRTQNARGRAAQLEADSVDLPTYGQFGRMFSYGADQLVSPSRTPRGYSSWSGR